MGTWPQDFAINKEVLFLLFPEEKMPSKCRAPSKYEMLPTSLENFSSNRVSTSATQSESADISMAIF